VAVTKICLTSRAFRSSNDVAGTSQIALSRRQHGFESRWGYTVGFTPFGGTLYARSTRPRLLGALFVLRRCELQYGSLGIPRSEHKSGKRVAKTSGVGSNHTKSVEHNGHHAPETGFGYSGVTGGVTRSDD
jgi:hypothetical protein